MRFGTFIAAVTLAGICWGAAADGAEIVKDGKPVATIVIDTASPTTAPMQTAPRRARAPQRQQQKRQRADRAGRSRGGFDSDVEAADVLVHWVKKMTGATLPISRTAPPHGTVIYVGAAATKAGLELDQIDSPSREGLRIVCDDQKLLLAGQSPTATVKAVCRLLEQLGCRYLMDSPAGEVYPTTADLRIGPLDVSEKPTLAYRKIAGSTWSGSTLWKVWNGAGGIEASTRHAWRMYVPQELFDEHPEYFALRRGERRRDDWYCTSNPELRQVFAENLITHIKAGHASPSISPPDGRGYCECERCKAQDDPQSIEPSSGSVCMTNRYVDFFNDVARRVAKEQPHAVLNFYAYADYSQPPTSKVRLEPNLCVWVAPIRFCRMHAIGAENCPSRRELQETIEGWAAIAKRIGYRTYNYNLAECTVPFSLLSVWRHDIPYLQAKGCVGVNLETLTCWQLYGPHLYLSLRLAYDPRGDAEAIMDDYFRHFYGPAAPAMKRYWTAVDGAFANLNCHSGGFHSVHLVYTPAFLAQCETLLDEASKAAGADGAFAQRVTMAREGLGNARQYREVFDFVNAGRLSDARKTANDLTARAEAQSQAGYGNHYTADYFRRFVAKHVDFAAAAAAPPARVVQVLPDEWKFAYDDEDAGAERGFARPEFDDAKWRSVKTFSQTLDAQGLPDKKTILWYRNDFDAPGEPAKRLTLLLIGTDGAATVYVNGAQAGQSTARRGGPLEVDVTPHVHAGRNTVAVRIDHRGISELFLGGLIRPVVLVDKGE